MSRPCLRACEQLGFVLDVEYLPAWSGSTALLVSKAASRPGCLVHPSLQTRSCTVPVCRRRRAGSWLCPKARLHLSSRERLLRIGSFLGLTVRSISSAPPPRSRRRPPLARPRGETRQVRASRRRIPPSIGSFSRPREHLRTADIRMVRPSGIRAMSRSALPSTTSRAGQFSWSRRRSA